jgi:hypothetical protein
MQTDPVGAQDLRDFVDEGMHVTWLVRDPTAFALSPGPTSERDRRLSFGLNYEEWLALYFDVLRVNREGFRVAAGRAADKSRVSISEFDSDDAALKNYPMLSRISGVLDDAVFESEEVDRLRQECLQVRANTSNVAALSGLDKLLLICAWAKKLDLNIYLMAD